MFSFYPSDFEPGIEFDGRPLYMKLRDQLRTDKETFYDWTPTWTNRQDPTHKLRGEIGNLEQVWITPEVADDILFIAIDYEGRGYMGAMLLDSPGLCRQLYVLLQSRIGLSIEEIGALDLP